MEDILARFLDGDIEEGDAALLLRMAREDPRLDRELREYETILSASERLPKRSPRDGFAERVMGEIGAPQEEKQPLSLRPWYAAAAALIMGLFLGYLGGAGSAPAVEGIETAQTAYPALVPVQVAHGGSGAESRTAVRLTYAGSRPDLNSVAVAGSFNGWDPTGAPMVLEEGVWTILLVLPPGHHEYMFVEDGDAWVTDPRAPGTRQDGFGGSNGLLAIRS
jgi:hypothetical protein